MSSNVITPVSETTVEKSMAPEEIQHLKKMVFLTHSWENVTAAIRAGKAPAGTASVYKIWERCRHYGIETHVVIVAPDDGTQPREYVALGGVRFHWLQPFGQSLVIYFSSKNLGFLLYWTKIVDWFRVFLLCRKHCKDAQVYYCMRWGFGPVAILLAKLSGGKSVLRLYGSFIYESWTKGGIYGKLCNVPNAMAMKLPFDLQITTNDGTRGDRVNKALRIKPERTRFWLNGITEGMHLPNFDVEAFKASLRFGIKPDDLVLMCTGRLQHWKRQDLLIKAMPEILRLFPNVKLLLLGNGECQSELQALCSVLGVDREVVFHGVVPNKELPAYLNCADIYLQVNDVSNVSTTLIEALSAGCCCVARNQGDMHAIIEHGKNGILVDGDCPQDIANVCIELLRDSQMRQSFRERALTDSLKRFQTWDQRLDRELIELSSLFVSNNICRTTTIKRETDFK
jgi:glycosyltransferase involved in cell wall biosynthesis